jgi:hypothetical protein
MCTGVVGPKGLAALRVLNFLFTMIALGGPWLSRVVCVDDAGALVDSANATCKEISQRVELFQVCFELTDGAPALPIGKDTISMKTIDGDNWTQLALAQILVAASFGGNFLLALFAASLSGTSR